MPKANDGNKQENVKQEKKKERIQAKVEDQKQDSRTTLENHINSHENRFSSMLHFQRIKKRASNQNQTLKTITIDARSDENDQKCLFPRHSRSTTVHLTETQ